MPTTLRAHVLTLFAAAGLSSLLAASGAGAADPHCKLGDTADCTAKCTKNDGESCASLGWMYVIGKGVTKSSAQALSYLQKGCTAGSSRGCVDLAYLYEWGIGVAKDEARALSDYKKACDSKDLYGCAHLGALYEFGKG